MNKEGKLTYVFVIITTFGAVMMQEAAIYQRSHFEIILGSILAGIGGVGLLYTQYKKRKGTPKEIRPSLKTMELKWWEHHDYQFDVPWWFTLLQGFFAEYQFYYVSEYLLLLIPLYAVTVLAVFHFIKRKFQLTLGPTIFVFYTCFLSIPFCVASLKQPEFLAFTFGIDEITSRRATALLSLYTQATLILSSAMLIAYSWRLGLLRKNKLDGRSFSKLTNEVIRKKHSAENLEDVEAICLDVPLIVKLFSQGNHASLISLGWSIIGRGLNQLSKKKGPTEKAKEICIYSPYFKSSKNARDKFLHARYRPTYRDSLDTLKVVKDLLEVMRSSEIVTKG